MLHADVQVHQAAIAGAGNARQRWRQRTGLVLRVRDARGRIGRGEASPLPGFSTESFGQARPALTDWCPRTTVEELDAAPLAAVAAELESLPPLASVQLAVETALLDLAGQRLGRPVWSLLGAAQPTSVAIAALVTEIDPDSAAETASRAVARGLSTLKIKIGRPDHLDDEIAVVRAVRRAVGAEIEIRLDANGSLDPSSLETTLGRFAAAGSPSLIEEPLGGPPLGDVVRTPIPVAVDETLMHDEGMAVVERLAGRGICAAVVLKPMALGGALACLDFARRAHDLGVDAYVTHLFDGPIARTAAAHLALALPGPRRACGLDHHGALAGWPDRGAKILASASVVPDGAPGLGLEVD